VLVTVEANATTRSESASVGKRSPKAPIQEKPSHWSQRARRLGKSRPLANPAKMRR
jgi:hypothetical protein